MTEEKIYTMTEEDKKFKDFSDKILSELESQENITFEDLVKKALEVNPITREELEHRFDEITAFGFNIRKVPKFSCLLPYHIMFSDWTPENYRKDRVDMFARYDKDVHFIISMGLCSQEFNTTSDKSIERFLGVLEHFEQGKKKVMETLEKTRREQEEIVKEIDEIGINLKSNIDSLRKVIEKQKQKEKMQRTKDRIKRMRKYVFASKLRRFVRFLAGQNLANYIWIHMMMTPEEYKRFIANGLDDNV